MEIKLTQASVNDLHGTAYNPEARTNNRKLRNLSKSMATYGSLVPIIITEDNRIIDGHRRVACAKSLGIETLNALVISDVNPDMFFIETNTTQKPMSKKERFQAKRGGGEVSLADTRLYNKLSEIYTEKDLDLFATEDKTPDSLYNFSTQLLRYAGLPLETEPIRRVSIWMATFAAQYPTRRAISWGVDPDIIMSYVEQNKPLPNVY
jgi:hypothetical protein